VGCNGTQALDTCPQFLTLSHTPGHDLRHMLVSPCVCAPQQQPDMPLAGAGVAVLQTYLFMTRNALPTACVCHAMLMQQQLQLHIYVRTQALPRLHPGTTHHTTPYAL
jgi:hypothetical protein